MNVIVYILKLEQLEQIEIIIFYCYINSIFKVWNRSQNDLMCNLIISFFWCRTKTENQLVLHYMTERSNYNRSKSERGLIKMEESAAGYSFSLVLDLGNKGRTEPGSAALIWVTGLWGTVITPLSSSGLKWCFWAWRTLANEPACSQTLGNTFLITELSYIHAHSGWFKCTTLLAAQVNLGCFYSATQKRSFVQLQFGNKSALNDGDAHRHEETAPSIPIHLPCSSSRTVSSCSSTTASENRVRAERERTWSW